MNVTRCSWILLGLLTSEFWENDDVQHFVHVLLTYKNKLTVLYLHSIALSWSISGILLGPLCASVK